MLNLEELEMLAAFAQAGTLSRVADQFHISTPSVTRAMQHVERDFGVTLFMRGKNRIELNETGEVAAEQARKLLDEARRCVQQVRDFDQRRRTLVVKSCAPAPLWELQRNLNTQQPGMMVATEICTSEEVQAAWDGRMCDIAILPYPFDGAEPFMEENLFVSVPHDHELARHKSLKHADIDGFNFLLRTELGFWDAMCREKMPASKFLVQPDASVFVELIKASSLPCFTTDYAGVPHEYPGRVEIPIDEPEAHATFFIARR